MPAARSTRFVSSLSPPVSTAMCEVRLVMLPRIQL